MNKHNYGRQVSFYLRNKAYICKVTLNRSIIN